MTESQGLPEEASSTWHRVVDEAEELAVDYRERDWEAEVVHPGDVTAVVKDDHFGLNVLAPDSEYDRVRALVDRYTFDRSHVYRRSRETLTFLVCLFEATDDGVVVLVPAYVSATDLERLYPHAEEADEMPILVRPLEYQERATLTVDDPGLFFESET